MSPLFVDYATQVSYGTKDGRLALFFSYELNIKKLNADSLKKSLKIIAGYFPPATTYSKILKFNEFNIAEMFKQDGEETITLIKN